MKPLISETQALRYQTDDGTTRVEVRMAGETVWLNQNQMADLFQTTKQNVGQHIRNVFAEGELAERIYATNHPIYAMLSDPQALDMVRIIEGRE